jgi:hypothetical protein
MNDQQVFVEHQSVPYTIEEIAAEVAAILAQRISAQDILRLCQVVFLDVEEVAVLLRVKTKTISTWISQDKIPVRYAGVGRFFFCPSSYNGLCRKTISILAIDSL